MALSGSQPALRSGTVQANLVGIATDIGALVVAIPTGNVPAITAAAISLSMHVISLWRRLVAKKTIKGVITQQ